MKLRYKIAGTLAGTLILAVSALAFTISRTQECGPAPDTHIGENSMAAITYRCYGSPEVLELSTVSRPTPAADEVLIKVHSAGVNPLDWHYMRGSPYIMRLSSGLGAPEDKRMGVDFAGTVEAIGNDVTAFKPGDAVFGGGNGAFAQYLTLREDRALAHTPDGTDHEQAAAMPIAALTALQALRDKGQLKAGQKVLINGASGGVGTYAVQIAKAMGAEVTGVCSTRNLELVRSLGADQVIDYTREDYTDSGEQYDLIVDNVGNHSPLANRSAMTPQGRLVMVGGSSGDWLGPLIAPLKAMLLAPFVDQEFILLMATLNQADLQTLAGMMAAGEIRSVIDQRFSLTEVAEAIAYSESGRVRGKIILEVD